MEKIDGCKFCELLVKQLREGTGHFKGFPEEVREQYLDSMNRESPYRENVSDLKKFGPIMAVTSYCRGFGLCKKHISTIKRDNKVRAKKGIDIPNDLSIISKMRLFDWMFAFFILVNL